MKTSLRNIYCALRQSSISLNNQLSILSIFLFTFLANLPNAVATAINFKAMLSLGGVTVINCKETAANNKEVANKFGATITRCEETINANHAMLTHCNVMASADDVMVINIRSNTIQSRCNEELMSCQYDSMYVAIRFVARVMRFNNVSIPINIRSNPILRRSNTRQRW